MIKHLSVLGVLGEEREIILPNPCIHGFEIDSVGGVVSLL
jgi:hypothetical protein